MRGSHNCSFGSDKGHSLVSTVVNFTQYLIAVTQHIMMWNSAKYEYSWHDGSFGKIKGKVGCQH